MVHILSIFFFVTDPIPYSHKQYGLNNLLALSIIYDNKHNIHNNNSIFTQIGYLGSVFVCADKHVLEHKC